MVEVKCCHRKKPKPERNQVKKKLIEAKKGIKPQETPQVADSYEPIRLPNLISPCGSNYLPVSTPILEVNPQEFQPPCYHCDGPDLFLQYTLPQENFGPVENLGFTAHFGTTQQQISPECKLNQSSTLKSVISKQNTILRNHRGENLEISQQPMTVSKMFLDAIIRQRKMEQNQKDNPKVYGSFLDKPQFSLF